MATSLTQQPSLFDLGGGPVCQKCKLDIGSKPSIQAAGFTWHANGCFTCSFCTSDISDSFVERYQRVFCVDCEKKLFGQYCGEKLGDHAKLGSGCGKLVTDEFVQANDRIFHPMCLCCSRCKRNSDVVGELFLYNNQFLCTPCTKIAKKS